MIAGTDALEVWRKIERSVELAQETAQTRLVTESKKGKTAEDLAEERRMRWWRRTSDVFGSLFWLYVITKLFVIDVDRLLLDATVPSRTYLLDYRLFAYLGLAAVIVLSRNRKVYLGTAYVLAFPLVLLFWKLPVFFVKRRSWTLLLAAMNAVFVFFNDFRYNFLTKFLASLAALLILISAPPWVTVLSAAYLFALVIWSIGRAIRRSFRLSPFLSVQREKISKLIASPRLRGAYAIPDDLKRADIEVYTQEQIGKFAVSLSLAIGINRGLYFWAYQLERYRKNSSAPMLLSGFTYIWLFLGTMAGLSLVNYSLLEVSPEQYSFETWPSFIAVLFYSLSSLALAEGGGLSASGDIALLLRIFAGFAGVVFLASFVLNIILTYRRERDEVAIREVIEDLKRRARQQEEILRAEYAVGVDEARRRLEDVAAAFAQWLDYLTASIPSEFLETRDSARRPA